MARLHALEVGWRSVKFLFLYQPRLSAPMSIICGRALVPATAGIVIVNAWQPVTLLCTFHDEARLAKYLVSVSPKLNILGY